jgi:hypothetical protein
MFRVRWLDEADDQLAAIWMRVDSEKRRAVTEATNAIDRELKSDPFRQSESRENKRRVLFVPPLGIFFSVDTKRRVVRVVRVWYFPQRPK